MSRTISALWRLALALMVLLTIAELIHEGQIALAVTTIAVPIGFLVLLRAQRSRQGLRTGTDTDRDFGLSVLRQLSGTDQKRIADLVECGNMISAIAVLRRLTGADLRTAKSVVEQLTSEGSSRSSPDYKV